MSMTQWRRECGTLCEIAVKVAASCDDNMIRTIKY